MTRKLFRNGDFIIVDADSRREKELLALGWHLQERLVETLQDSEMPQETETPQEQEDITRKNRKGKADA